jgi:hypothetical protein
MFCRSEGAPIKRGDPTRQGIDEAVQLGVR